MSFNAMNLMECKQIKGNSVTRSRIARSLIKINRIRKRQATFLWPCDEKGETRTGVIEGKVIRGKQREKMLSGLTKWLKVGRVTEPLKSSCLKLFRIH